jgi:hypothetical protein
MPQQLALAVASELFAMHPDPNSAKGKLETGGEIIA